MLPRPDLCCGFGGTFSVRQPEVSVAMADDKLGGVGAVGAEALVTADPGCLMHLRGRARKVGELPVVHLATALARAYLPRGHRMSEGLVAGAGAPKERFRDVARDEARGRRRPGRRSTSPPRGCAGTVSRRGASSRTSRSCASARTRFAWRRCVTSTATSAEFTERSRPAAATSRSARPPRRPARTSSTSAAGDDAKLVAKSKSMATEEIRLNDALERRRDPSPSRPISASTSSSSAASTRSTSSRRRSRRRRRTSPSSSPRVEGREVAGRARGARPSRRAGSCARSSSTPTWASRARTSSSPRRARSSR